MYETLLKLVKNKSSLSDALNYLESLPINPEYDQVFNFNKTSKQDLVKMPTEFRLKRLFEVFILTNGGATDPNILHQKEDVNLILAYLIDENFDKLSPQLILELVYRLYPSVPVSLNSKIKLFELKEIPSSIVTLLLVRMDSFQTLGPFATINILIDKDTVPLLDYVVNKIPRWLHFFISAEAIDNKNKYVTVKEVPYDR